MNVDPNEAWEIFMKLCEEYPELYDKYVEKTENRLKDYTPEFEITEEDRKRAFDKLQERIKKEQ